MDRHKRISTGDKEMGCEIITSIAVAIIRASGRSRKHGKPAQAERSGEDKERGTLEEASGQKNSKYKEKL